MLVNRERFFVLLSSYVGGDVINSFFGGEGQLPSGLQVTSQQAGLKGKFSQKVEYRVLR